MADTFPPGLTPTVGLAMTGDEVMNRNLARIDTALAELRAAAGDGGSSDLTALTARVDALEASMSALEARVTALETP
jgi:hypothetical protein